MFSSVISLLKAGSKKRNSMINPWARLSALSLNLWGFKFPLVLYELMILFCLLFNFSMEILFENMFYASFPIFVKILMSESNA